MSNGNEVVCDASPFTDEDSNNEVEPADLTSVEGRIRTFVNWPIALDQDPRQMSEAGFFYTGTGDQVRCFKCNLQLNDWKTEHVVWERHAASKPDCPHVLEKGPRN